MALSPSIASSNIADLFTRPLPINSHHRYTQLIIGDDPIAPTTSTTSVATATVDPSATVAPTPTVDSVTVATTVVASVSAPTTPIASDSVLSHPNLVPIVLDTGASFSLTPFASDFLLSRVPYGLFRSPTSVISKALASTPVDPYTLITGEDAIDLSCPDIDSDYIDSDSGPSFTKVSFDIREFGTATLTLIYSKSSSELLHIFVDPNQIDWLHWVPLPRLTPTESYFHICGRDYLQAFVLFHLIPIWIALVSALLRSE